MDNVKKGNVFVVTGPSGVGKGTVMKRLMELDDKLALSISATTRSPRSGEVDGVNYYFISRESFQQKIDENGFLEHAEYVGNFYGTPKQPVIEKTEQGYDVILEIEVQGGIQVMNSLPEAEGIFIFPPSYEALENRLRGRGSESGDVIEKRLAMAKEEISKAYLYDDFVINDTVENAAKKILKIIKGKRNR